MPEAKKSPEEKESFDNSDYLTRTVLCALLWFVPWSGEPIEHREVDNVKVNPNSPLAVVMSAIALGELDDVIEPIKEAIKDREAELLRRILSGAKPGQRIRFSPTTRPRYLVGRIATIVRVNDETITVDFPPDPVYKKYRRSKGVRVPNEWIEEVFD